MTQPQGMMTETSRLLTQNQFRSKSLALGSTNWTDEDHQPPPKYTEVQ